MASTLSPLLLASDPMFLQAGNSYAMADPQKLLNPNRTAMLIDEIRFNKFGPPPNQGPTPAEIDFFTLAADIKLGAIPLTNGYIPLRCFCPTYVGAVFDSTVTWHLPRPLYVPPDVQLSVSAKRLFMTGDFPNNNPLIVSVAGRSIPAGQPVPKTVYMPWACGFSISAPGESDIQIPTFESTDADIVNPFDTPMRTSYFTGLQLSGQGEVIAPLYQPILVQATLSNGKEFIRDPVPFFALFPAERPLLRARALLQPKEFIRFQLEVQEPNLFEPDFNTLSFTEIGMVGYRELQTPMGALP